MTLCLHNAIVSGFRRKVYASCSAVSLDIMKSLIERPCISFIPYHPVSLQYGRDRYCQPLEISYTYVVMTLSSLFWTRVSIYACFNSLQEPVSERMDQGRVDTDGPFIVSSNNDRAQTTTLHSLCEVSEVRAVIIQSNNTS